MKKIKKEKLIKKWILIPISGSVTRREEWDDYKWEVKNILDKYKIKHGNVVKTRNGDLHVRIYFLLKNKAILKKIENEMENEINDIAGDIEFSD